MYDSNQPTFFVDENTKTERTEILIRLYEMGFNLIPVNGKHPPCIEWKPYQQQRVTIAEIKHWMHGKFRSKDGKKSWKVQNLNFAMLTGAVPWSAENPGVVVVDTDDDEAEELVNDRCPDTPMMQITGSGGVHRIYRHPDYYVPIRQKTWQQERRYAVDIRGDGGYIMAPGSIHPRTGRMYRESLPWSHELLIQCPVYDPSWIPCEHSVTKSSTTRLSMPSSVGDGDHEDLIAEIETSIEDREAMASRYLESVPGTQQGDGADRRCTALTMKLLYGFALPVESVQKLLSQWGQRDDQLDDAGGWYPWSEGEIARKIDWCLNHEYQGEVGDRLCDSRDLGDMESQVHEIVEPFEVGPTINPKDQLEVAEMFYRDYFTSNGGGTLIHHQAIWHHWTGKRYEVISEDDIKARLWTWLAKCSVKTKKDIVSFQPNRGVVSGVMDALKAVANQPSSLEVPCWLTSGPEQVIAFENGLLDVDKFLDSGKTELLPHTPRWFSSFCLPHKFDESATCPKWLDFLNEVFDGDQERIETLQQWLGYNLVADNRQHKIAMLIGPPRSGKGTTLAVMSELLGQHNVANSSLASLGGRFGLEPLVGKLAAIIDEGHLGKFSNSSLVLERLKAISGGSSQTVDRKGLPAMANVALKLRFTIAVNELPRLSDTSAAMRSRLLILPYFNTYEGKEDFGLVDRLLSEIPGITNWALAGLQLLSKQGRFINPSAGEKILRDFVYLSSPMQAFLDECCEVGSDKEVCRSDLQLAWHIWCDQNGHVPGSVAGFGKRLRSVVPRVDDERRQVNNQRVWWCMGVGLTPEAHADITRRRNGA